MGKIEYGISYFGVRDPKHARRDLDRFVDAGLDAVLHTFSERDRRYYRRTMSEIVEASHDRDLTVYMNPWGFGNVFGGETLTEFPARHPEACQQLSDDRRVPAACFNAPIFRQSVRGWINDAVSTGADIIFWDEPHWFEAPFRGENVPEDPWTCRCPHCRPRYEEAYGETMPEELTDSIRTFKVDSIVRFLEDMTETTAEAGVKNAVCLAPDPSNEEQFDRLERFASLEHLDVISATPFWDFHDEDPKSFVGRWTEKVTSIAREQDLRSQVWIQGFDLDNTGETRQGFRTAIEVAKSHDPDSLFLWGWDGCRTMSSIACGDPEGFWEDFTKHWE